MRISSSNDAWRSSFMIFRSWDRSRYSFANYFFSYLSFSFSIYLFILSVLIFWIFSLFLYNSSTFFYYSFCFLFICPNLKSFRASIVLSKDFFITISLLIILTCFCYVAFCLCLLSIDYLTSLAWLYRSSLSSLFLATFKWCNSSSYRDFSISCLAFYLWSSYTASFLSSFSSLRPSI
jgi:hypothetical protein